jgi:hypothetical protein
MAECARQFVAVAGTHASRRPVAGVAAVHPRQYDDAYSRPGDRC